MCLLQKGIASAVELRGAVPEMQTSGSVPGWQ